MADTLSRPEASSCSFPAVDYAALAAAQDASDAEETSLQVAPVEWRGIRLLCDVSTGTPRPLVPPAFRRPIFDALHSLSHAGARPTVKMVSERFIWPGLRRDVRDWCRRCHPCQASKVARHIKTPVTVMPPASRRFGCLHLDIVGPLPPSEEHLSLIHI